MKISKKRLLEIIQEELLNEVEPSAPSDSIEKLSKDIERFQNSGNPMLRVARDIFNKAGDDVTRHGLERNEMIIADLYYALFATRQRLNALVTAPVKDKEPDRTREPSTLPQSNPDKFPGDWKAGTPGLEIDEGKRKS